MFQLISKLLNINILSINMLLFLFIIVLLHLTKNSEYEKLRYKKSLCKVERENVLQKMKINELNDVVAVLMKKSQEDEKTILNHLATDLYHKDKFKSIKNILYSNRTYKSKISSIKNVFEDEEISDN